MMNDNTLFFSRINRLKDFLSDNNCEGILIEEKINLFYLTGLMLSAGVLYVTSDKVLLCVDSRYLELCQKRSPFAVELLDDTKKLSDYISVKTLGFDSQTTSYARFLALQKRAQTISGITLIPLENPVKKLRMIKDEAEIKLLEEASDLGSKGFDYVCSLLKEGVTELEIASELEIFWKRLGSRGLAFEPIIAFGANSSMPHYRSGNTKLASGMPVLIDIGVNYQHYHSDMTRVLFFGKPIEKMKEIYQVVKESQQAALDCCVTGVNIGELDHTARAVIKKAGYEKYFTHNLGHGVGLEIHELPMVKNTSPFDRMPLEAGMVITIEPGIYLPNVGGVRIEDTIVITSNGYRNLTKRSKDLLIV